jgi:voltage-gated potassium channel
MPSEGSAGAPQSKRFFGRAKSGTVTAPLRLADLDVNQRRRALARCVLTIVISWVIILGAYYVLPIDRESELRAVFRVAADIALITSVFSWQLGRISRAELPELRAMEALGIVVVLFLALFSGIYLALSRNSGAFTQSLDQTKALYFTISVFSTVGFGDITPRTDPARLIVSAQMLLDLVVIGAVVRLIFNTARSRVGSTAAPLE